MATTTVTKSSNWTTMQKFALRFCIVFFTLYIFFTPNNCIPYTDAITNFYLQPFHWLITWIAGNILQMRQPVVFVETGSGDRLCDYLVWLLCALIAGLTALIWTCAHKKNRSYDKLFYWACVIVRYYLAFSMLFYGLAKVIKIQFPFPSLHRLVQPFGSASPMGLIWTYMGYSTGFNYFTGIGEIACAILLLFRRTTTLGAILALVITANIMAVNYFYDVPVKILSTMLMLMSVFLLTKDAARLVNFFLLNKSILPLDSFSYSYKKQWQNIAANSIKYLLISYTIIGFIIFELQRAYEYGDIAKKPPLYGIYDVKNFVLNNDTIAPLITDTIRWRKLIINSAGYARVVMMNDTTLNYEFEPDAKTHTIMINKVTDSTHKYTFAYIQIKNGGLQLKGKWLKGSLTVTLDKFNLKKFTLVNRAFHWINENPYNK